MTRACRSPARTSRPSRCRSMPTGSAPWSRPAAPGTARGVPHGACGRTPGASGPRRDACAGRSSPSTGSPRRGQCVAYSFGQLDHSWLSKFLEHRIADKRVLRLIDKWVNAGVIEDGKWSASDVGAPQGASASPLLANVYLHYVFDRWARQWRRRHAHGAMIVVRFADDFVCGFEHEGDAQQFLSDLRERFSKFGLALHPDKTRLIEFGRNAARNRAARGVGKPETFDYLGFTHYCGKRRTGRFWLKRKTIAKRMRAKLAEVKDQLRRRRHLPIPVQGQWLGSVVRGHLAYYAVPGNTDAVAAFRTQVTRHWLKSLRRRSQRHRLNWERMNRIATRWLPTAKVQHPFPNVRFDARTRGRSPVR